MVEPRYVHWISTKNVLRYIHGTVGYGLRYVSDGAIKMQGYTNFDWAGSVVEGKNTSGCCFSLGSGMISWLRRKQKLVALSTTEAKYIATNVVSREAVWLQKLIAGLFDLELEPALIHCNNQSCINISENIVFHDILKYIKIKYHYIRDMAQRGAVVLWYINTDEHIVNILTKPLSRVKYEYFRDKLGVMQNVHPR
jgi:hypothetical protein